ncbi:MAG: hypothetical protein ACRC28_00175 [Clostridium sp.]|uniref:hypothetical protein n=1 Tax=Clostridium sp. TaxID=1506 RepID=UPI003F383862
MRFELENEIKVEKMGDVLVIDKRKYFCAKTKMFILISEISGAVLVENILVLQGSGIKICEITEKNLDSIRRLPNAIVGKPCEIEKLYEEILLLVQNIPNM